MSGSARARLVRGVWIGCVLGATAGAQAYNPDWLGTASELRALQRVLHLYEQDYGGLPRSNAQSTWWEKLEGSEYGLALWEGAPVDRWGSAYIYDPDVVDQRGLPLVRSVGANGIDEGGAGDDLTAGREVNDGYYWKRNWPRARRLGAWFAAGFLLGVVPVLVMVKQAQRLWWSVAIVYACVAAIVVCPLMATPFDIPTYRPAPVAWIAYRAAWFVGPLAIAMQVCVLAIGWMRKRSAWRVGRCQSCGYDLRGLTSVRCPECGREATTR